MSTVIIAYWHVLLDEVYILTLYWWELGFLGCNGASFVILHYRLEYVSFVYGSVVTCSKGKLIRNEKTRLSAPYLK